MTVSLAARIEAILYLKGQPLSLTAIAEHAKCDRDAAADALLQLMDDYAHRDSALELLEDERGFCLQLRPALQELVHELLPVDLTTGTLRTLAAIALKGRIAQTDLVDLRGSGAYQQVQELVEQGFIQKRRQSNGRSYWLEVTDKFHQYFQTEGMNLEALIPARSQSTDNAMAESTAPAAPEVD
ncbi:SMC-Scp complex subunit ScpB [Synechococcus elongatus]|uniref:Condensin subunit ScpB n=2 Tax=Synechococcus elongatus TaxID=32046 RepID=Q8GMQ3_SYNE7|nr:SMC-Scp complex subunit ScpB [Synechococcus elongatus]ABB56458.1 condensin subunit ScpB [Synechococcus elongatus PCC 7942 = FACHB-805]AJD56497.1 transcriptional regulator [Synechococcus elongatus UTEX 2973]MBD2588960.1 SMC-Scp complex subunit ScpB [Synechococcus elongatus FACHB-242]MBD2690026.1 SMC-Scp complex subunit ScpB [Synechococcus elongatus FACHB-1061]MBD2706997.1 SMC-Scp complex subunit ScpB [Synechococcus elongatus PCC 7942 = FACHB-805]